MPKRKIPVKKLVPPPLPINEVSEEELMDEPTEDEIADANKLEEMRAQLGGRQYTVRVERYNPETSEMEIVDRFSFDTFDPFVLAKRYNGGRFICTLYNDKSKYVEGGRFHYNFALAKPEVQNVSPLKDPSVIALIEQMKSTQGMIIEILKTSLTGQPQTPIDQLTNALKSLHDLGPKVEKENPMKNLKELLELQLMFKESTTDEEKDGSVKGVFSEIAEAMKLLMESKKIQTPTAGRSPLPMKTMGGLPVIQKINPDKTEKEETMSPALKKILFYVPQFEEAAQNSEDPDKWAGILLDILDVQVIPLIEKQFLGMVTAEGVWEMLLQAAEDEQKIEKIYEYAHVLEPYREWVVKVIQSAVKQFDSEEIENPVSTTVNGDNHE